jgi:Mce-associated membrane protein
VAGLRKPAGTSPKPSPRPRPRPEPVSEAEQPRAEQAQAERTEAGRGEVPQAPQPDVGVERDTRREQAPGEPVEDRPAASGDEPETGAGDAPRPSPRRKVRDTGARRPESEQEITREAKAGTPRRAAHAAEPARDGVAVRKRRYVLAAAFGVLALVFAGIAVVFQLNRADISSATANKALLDVGKTAQVQQEVDAAVEALFSYDFNDIAKTERAANDLLATDEVREQYNKQFAEVKRLAPEQKIVVTSNVTRSAVVRLQDDRARVLVFVDQTSTRTDEGQTNTGGSQLAVTTELRDGSWKITGLNTYSEGLPQQPGTQESQQQLPGAGNQPTPGN